MGPKSRSREFLVKTKAPSDSSTEEEFRVRNVRTVKKNKSATSLQGTAAAAAAAPAAPELNNPPSLASLRVDLDPIENAASPIEPESSVAITTTVSNEQNTSPSAALGAEPPVPEPSKFTPRLSPPPGDGMARRRVPDSSLSPSASAFRGKDGAEAGTPTGGGGSGQQDAASATDSKGVSSKHKRRKTSLNHVHQANFQDPIVYVKKELKKQRSGESLPRIETGDEYRFANSVNIHNAQQTDRFIVDLESGKGQYSNGPHAAMPWDDEHARAVAPAVDGGEVSVDNDRPWTLGGCCMGTARTIRKTFMWLIVSILHLIYSWLSAIYNIIAVIVVLVGECKKQAEDITLFYIFCYIFNLVVGGVFYVFLALVYCVMITFLFVLAWLRPTDYGEKYTKKKFIDVEEVSEQLRRRDDHFSQL